MNLFFKFVKSAIQDVFANKVRSFLTVLGILIGISSVTLMVSIGESAQIYINQSITNTLGKNIVIMQPGGGSSGGFSISSVLTTLSDDDYNAVKNWNTGDVQYVARRQLASYKLRFGTIEETAITYAMDAEYFRIVNLTLLAGKYPRVGGEPSRNIVINESVRKKFFKLQDPIGKTINVQGFDFKVIGVVKNAAGQALGDSFETYIDVETYRQLFRKPDTFNALIIGIDESKTNVTDFKPKLERLMRQEHQLVGSDKSDFSITTQADIVETTNTILGTVTLFITVISAISLVVGGIGVMNIMLVSVKERVKEIGLRKAIGATNQDIQTQILIESVLFSLIGGVAGIIFGGLGALVLEQVAGLPLHISMSAIGASLGVSSFVGIVFGLYPAIQAGRLSPIEALRSN